MINLARERSEEGLAFNNAALLAQAEKINALLDDEAIRELFAFLRTSKWAQSRLNSEFRQGSFVIASLDADQTSWIPQNSEDYAPPEEPSFAQLLNNINTR